MKFRNEMMSWPDRDVLQKCTVAAGTILKAFLFAITCICVWNAGKLFLQMHGIRHRLAGAMHLGLLIVGAWTTTQSALDATTQAHLPHSFFWTYDLLLGCSGVVLTLTAAHDFPHKYVVNHTEDDCVQSGTLHQQAMVTHDEMIEHAFYQALNLWQAMYLHTQYYLKDDKSSVGIQLVLLWLVTAPWLVRGRLPVHSFSHNWKLYEKQQQEQQKAQKKLSSMSTKQPPPQSSTEVTMYRIKKAQYIFYKHCILHGVNLAVAINDRTLSDIPYSTAWRTFWILLNTSYVMEFFLQSLVKRHVLQQNTMLWFNQVLMVAASLGATVLLRHVPLWMVAISIVMNFGNRHHDVMNTMGIAVAILAWRHVAKRY
jgi:hypothetical protein